MIIIITAILSAFAGGYIVHFGWARFHADEQLGMQVILDEAKTTERAVKSEVQYLKDKIAALHTTAQPTETILP